MNFLWILTSLAVMFSAPSAQALAERSFQDYVSAPMVLKGEGIKRFLMKKAMTVRLFAPDGLGSERILENHSKCIDVRYHWRISGSVLHHYIVEKMRDNADAGGRELESRFQDLQKILPDIHYGDFLTMCYDPADGTDFLYNDRWIGNIPGEDFGRVVFATWIGRYPVDRHLKKHLLGI